MTKTFVRTLVRRSFVVGGVAVGGVIGFPRFEDWYWLHHVKEQEINERQHFDKNSDESQKQRRQRLVILGSGWASASVLKHINRDKYDITVVSPRNFFLFTPLLPSVATGTITQEAVTVPIRDIMSYKSLSYYERLKFIYRGYLPPRIKYVYAAGTNINPTENKIQCTHISKDHTNDTFDLSYDQLILGIGATNNTFGTKGVDENCHYLKQTGDASIIRQHIISNLEKASLPTTTEEEKKKLLTFLIVGGGPTGVEFAVELQDFLMEDAVNTETNARPKYPYCVGYPTVSIIQSNQHLLPGFPPKLQEFAEEHIVDMGINLWTNKRVTKVSQDTISVLDKKTKTVDEIPYGSVVWATGVSPGKLAKQLMKVLPSNLQTSHRCIKVDSHCKVLGTNNIYAIGDCSDIDVLPEYKAVLLEVYDSVIIGGKEGSTMASNDDDQSRRLSEEENIKFLHSLNDRIKYANRDQLGLLNDYAHHHGLLVQEKLVEDLQSMLEAQQKKKKNGSSEFQGLSKADLIEVATEQLKRQNFLPPLAQVAHQQGEYLAELLNHPKIITTTAEADEVGGGNDDDQTKKEKWTYDHGPPFRYKNLGKLVYVGANMAAMAVPKPNDENAEISWGGSIMNVIWHAAYFGMLESPNARSELLFDWIKGKIFGRSTVLNAVCTSDSDSHIDALTRPRKTNSGSSASEDAAAAAAPAAKKGATTKKWFW